MIAPLRALLVAGIGLYFGISAFSGGLYRATLWQAVLLAGLTLLLGCFVARPFRPTGTGLFAIGSLVVLWLLSLLSGIWAEEPDLAVTDANRWLLYAVLLGLLTLLLTDVRSRRLVVGAATAGICLLALYLLARLLLGEGEGLFLLNRLNDPLNYVNGMAAYLILGIWPLVALAERTKNVLIQGAAILGVTLLLNLSLLAQSRGALIALVGSAIVLFAFVPGRAKRGWILFFSLAGSLVAGSSLPTLLSGIDQVPSGSDLQIYALKSLAGGLVAGLIWVLLHDSLRKRLVSVTPKTRKIVDYSSAIVLSVIVAGAMLAFLLPVQQTRDRIETQISDFTSLESTGTGSRLVSGGGNRFDYWRVAWRQFEDNPLTGVGAGNYRSTYYADRSTGEYVVQAHSIQLQLLGEVGIFSMVALSTLVAAVVLAFFRTARSPETRGGDPFLAVGAGGVFLVWFIQTSIDWLHLIPAVTGIALCSVASLMPASRRLTRSQPLIIALFAGVIVLASFPVAKQYLALQQQENAREALTHNPILALKYAQGSLDFEDSQKALYTKSAALARLGEYVGSKSALVEATQRAPSDFVPRALLGDIEFRRGNLDAALDNYQRALELNPLNSELPRQLELVRSRMRESRASGSQD